MRNEITILMPTSPIPSHPSTEVIDGTIASIRAQPELADCKIIVMADGVRSQQANRRLPYRKYIAQLQSREDDTLEVAAFADHLHQGTMARLIMEGNRVTTPLILYVEHDTPLCGEFPWENLVKACHTGRVNLIRFHHESHVLDVHRYLMLDDTPIDIAGVPLLRTAQWSQRPHLARADFYRTILSTYFGYNARTMIEDVMHGVVDQAFRERGQFGWDDYKVWMYAPPGDIKRSLHSDGRKADPKFDMIFEYDEKTPAGAPRATSERTD